MLIYSNLQHDTMTMLTTRTKLYDPTLYLNQPDTMQRSVNIIIMKVSTAPYLITISTAEGTYKSDTNNNNIIIHTHTHTHTQRCTHTDAHTHTHTHSQTHRDAHTHTHMHIHTHTHTHTHTYTHHYLKITCHQNTVPKC